MAAVLRANALEKLGRPDLAGPLLIAAMEMHGPAGRKAVEGFIGLNASMQLCAQTFQAASGAQAQTAAASMGRAAGGGAGGVVLGVGCLLLVGTIGCFIAAVVGVVLYGLSN